MYIRKADAELSYKLRKLFLRNEKVEITLP